MDRFVQRLVGSLAVLSTVSSCLIMIAVVLDVTTRFVTGGSLAGMVDATESFMVVLVFFGLAQAERSDEHVKMRLVTERLPEGVVHSLRILSYTVYAAITGWFLWAVTRRAVTAFLQGEYRDGLMRWPLWPARIAIAVGMAALLLVVVWKLVRLWQGRDVSAPSSKPEPEQA